MMKLIRSVGVLCLFSLVACTMKEERKIAVHQITKATNTRESNTIKTSSAQELESQFKGCKAHW